MQSAAGAGLKNDRDWHSKLVLVCAQRVHRVAPPHRLLGPAILRFFRDCAQCAYERATNGQRWSRAHQLRAWEPAATADHQYLTVDGRLSPPLGSAPIWPRARKLPPPISCCAKHVHTRLLPTTWCIMKEAAADPEAPHEDHWMGNGQLGNSAAVTARPRPATHVPSIRAYI